MIDGFDTWGLGPSAADAKAAGMMFRTWYSSYDASKDGPVDGPAQFAAVGIWSVANFETTIDRVLSGGYAGGQQDMMHAINEYVPRGMPLGAVMIFSADEAIPTNAFAQALSYYQGARQAAAGQYLIGCYGEQALIAYLKDQSAIEVGWRSMSTAWPGGTSTASCDLVQTGSGQIGGVDVDYDTALVSFFGQWMPGKLAPTEADMTPEEHQMLVDIYAAISELLRLGRNIERIVSYEGRLAEAAANGGDAAAFREIPGLDFLLPGGPVSVRNPVAYLADLIAQVKVAPAVVDLTALKAEQISALTDPAVLKAEAHATAVELHDDTPAA